MEYSTFVHLSYTFPLLPCSHPPPQLYYHASLTKPSDIKALHGQFGSDIRHCFPQAYGTQPSPGDVIPLVFYQSKL